MGGGGVCVCVCVLWHNYVVAQLCDIVVAQLCRLIMFWHDFDLAAPPPPQLVVVVFFGGFFCWEGVCVVLLQHDEKSISR